MFSRRLFWLSLLFIVSLLFVGCPQKPDRILEKLSIGIVTYDTGDRALESYESFKNYLGEKIGALVELEPAFNELIALDRIQKGDWSMVFAPPGLAAVAMEKGQYIPIFPLQGVNNLRGILVVKKESKIQKITDLSQKIVALGQPGSAAGYYMPLYDLYGLTLAEIRFASTPKMVLEWLAQGTVEAGALSEEEFQQYRNELKGKEFRILHKTRLIPSGVVLLGPNINRNQQEEIQAAMREASPTIVEDAGYIPNAAVPNYQQFIEFVEKVRALETRVKEKPAILLRKNQAT